MKLTKKMKNKKDSFKKLIEFFINSFYLNPNKLFTIDEIKKKTDVDKEIIISFVKFLREKKLIRGRNFFKLTWDGLFYLENIINTKIEIRNNNLCVVLSLATLSISVFLIFDYPFYKILAFLLAWYIVAFIIPRQI